MKAQERSAVHAAPDDAPAEPTTGEWDGKVVAMGDDDFVELQENSDRAVISGGPNASSDAGKPARPASDAHLPRERRSTVVSNIPAQLAKSMGQIRDPAGPAAVRPWSEVRDAVLPPPSGRADVRPIPGAPAPMNQEITRPITAEEVAALEPEPDEPTDTYNVELFDDSSGPPAETVRSLVESARTHIEGGNLGAAVIAADQALAEAGKAPHDAEVADLTKNARPLFDRIFAAYVGLLGRVLVRARTDEQIAGQELGERTEYLLRNIDGKQTLEQLATSTGIPPVEAMKIAASLLAAGIVKVA
jgi:hypothetical protein